MNWLRSRLRAWLGVTQNIAYLTNSVNDISVRIGDLESEYKRLKDALKARASESKIKQVYTDYESSQQAVLAEFEEKNGVRS